MSLAEKVDIVVLFLRKNVAALSRCLVVFFYYLIGIAYYQKAEGWDITDCIYFITVSVTTVGYGSLVPTSDPARIFTCFYVLFGIGFVLTAALDVAKWLIKTVQNRLLLRLNSSDNIVLKEMNKIGLCVVFLTIAVLMGTCFFAVNEDWTAAQAFYWTIVTMTTVGYGDLKIKHHSTRQFSIFFIVYCVMVFAIAIQNINESYGEVKAYRGRIAVALLKQPKSALFTTSNETSLATAGDADIEGDSHTHITESDFDELKRKDMKSLFHLDAKASEGAIGDKVDCNEFVIEVLLKRSAINYDRDLEPILNHLRGVVISQDGLVDRAEIAKYCDSLNFYPDASPGGISSRNPIFTYGDRRPLNSRLEREKLTENVDGGDNATEEGHIRGI